MPAAKTQYEPTDVCLVVIKNPKLCTLDINLHQVQVRDIKVPHEVDNGGGWNGSMTSIGHLVKYQAIRTL